MRAQTQRLRLRDFTHDDEPVVIRNFADADVMRYIASGGTFEAERARASLGRWMSGMDARGFSIWAIEERSGPAGDVIGWCGLQPLPTSEHVEIGWLLERAYWGRGYATEAAAAALAFGFARAALERIVAVAHEEHAASINIMRKLGMRDAGRAFYYERETVFYVLDAHDFRPPAGIETFASGAGETTFEAG